MNLLRIWDSVSYQRDCQTIEDVYKGAIIFTGRGASICDGRSPISPGPPFADGEKILVPPGEITQLPPHINNESTQIVE